MVTGLLTVRVGFAAVSVPAAEKTKAPLFVALPKVTLLPISSGFGNETALALLEASVPPPSARLPVPSAVLAPTCNSPAASVVPPLYPLLTESVVTPLPS